ncbi:hypothetical protein SanaruYs_23940 [Chryseotalea sanaruensis]|uniref:Prolyl-tRNA synthetase n=1 Tax=Chryseotalea sanaruensis TaxID=2482724 RepID=A0A401UB63_9BACT|nr:hypothetical protein [Chryseotalea sanaruensis]GCC52158.1 hypothetical protein SanaruYs_23940 [Chryseotalea sanaruensis]
MKTYIIFAGLMICSTGIFAQVEHDDMYFRKNDRAKLNKQKENAAQEQNAQAVARGEKQLRFDYPINTKQAVPSQSNITNPEFIARSQSEMVAAEEQDYFIENYQYAPANNFDNFNNNFNAWNAAPLYHNSFFSPQINGWNSPYYSPFNDPFLMGYNPNPWCNPAFRSGWSVSFNYAWGNNWNYGWGNPYNNMMWGNSMWGWGGNPYYGNSFYSNRVIIIDNGNRGAVYGKRSSRGQNTAITSDNQRSTRVASYSRDNNSNVTSGGNFRQSTRSTQTEYYTPQWRRVTQQPAGTNAHNTPQNRVYNGGNRDYNNTAPAQQRQTYSAPAQRSSSPSYSAPSRSSSGGGSPSRSSRGGN